MGTADRVLVTSNPHIIILYRACVSRDYMCCTSGCFKIYICQRAARSVCTSCCNNNYNVCQRAARIVCTSCCNNATIRAALCTSCCTMYFVLEQPPHGPFRKIEKYNVCARTKIRAGTTRPIIGGLGVPGELFRDCRASSLKSLTEGFVALEGTGGEPMASFLISVTTRPDIAGWGVESAGRAL